MLYYFNLEEMEKNKEDVDDLELICDVCGCLCSGFFDDIVICPHCEEKHEYRFMREIEEKDKEQTSKKVSE